MARIISETGTLHRPDGTQLFWRAQRPKKNPKASIIIVHGLAEHSGRYEHVMTRFAESGAGIYALDLRGHGRSSGKRVFIRRFTEYVDDLQALILKAQHAAPEEPVYLVGHSMGGLVVVHHLLEYAGIAKGAILSSPGLDIAVEVPAWKTKIANLATKIYPGLAVPTGISSEWLSRDPEVVNAYERDYLVTHSATAGWFTAFTQAQARAFEKAPEIQVPLLLLSAGADKLVSVAAHERFIEKLGSKDKELKVYPELYHEIFNEPEHVEVLDDAYNWLKSRL